jgi:N-acyl-D-amino-acid deacylase
MTVLIRNVQILGSERKFPEHSDVLINGDKISAIGNFPNKNADETVDGQGVYLAPGFIDVNTDSDHYLTLFDEPRQDDFLKQGVTTIIGGMCGSSLAPLLYGGLESIQKWADISKFNVGWHTVGEFLKILGKKPLGVNFATLAGHSTIRRALIGDQSRELTKNELKVFGKILHRALEDGAFGLSTGLGYVHGQPTPYSELKYLAGIVKEFDGVYATHLRKGGVELGESVDETIKLAKETGVKTLISHFMPFFGSEKPYGAALKKIQDLPEKTDFHFDMYPYETSALPVYTFLPQWAQSGGKEKMLSELRDDWLRAKIEKELPKIKPDDFIVARAPGSDFLVGRSLKELEGVFNVTSHGAALLKLMLATELKCVAFYKNINKNFIKQALKNPRAFIASNSASFPDAWKERILKPERATSTFTKFLGMILSENIMPLEKAIRRITFEPAAKFNLIGRGLIKEGNFADFALFTRNSAGENGKTGIEIKAAIVNGAVILKDGVFTGHAGGRVLKHD